MKMTDLQLVEFTAGVSVGESQEHEFYNIHHGFLSARGVIPNEWKIKEPYNTPSLSSIEYENGVSLIGDEDSFQVSQTQDLKIGEENIPLGLVVKYLASIAPNVFKISVVEWEIQIPGENNSEWITERFFRPEIVSEKWGNVRTVSILGFKVEGLFVSLSFSGGRWSLSGKSDDTEIRVRCQIGHKPFSNDGELIGWLSEWHKHEEVMLSNLSTLLEIGDDSV